MGKRVLAAFGVAAPMDGVLASGLSAAPTSADAATSSTTERTGLPASLLKNAPYQAAVKPYLSRLPSKDAQEHAFGI